MNCFFFLRWSSLLGQSISFVFVLFSFVSPAMVIATGSNYCALLSFSFLFICCFQRWSSLLQPNYFVSCSFSFSIVFPDNQRCIAIYWVFVSCSLLFSFLLAMVMATGSNNFVSFAFLFSQSWPASLFA